MKKSKTFKITIKEALQKEQAGEMKLEYNQDEKTLNKKIANARSSFEKGNPAFDCKNCGAWYQPQADQWIFHNLCDSCFKLFDTQKMMGRFAKLMEEKQEQYFEDSDEWIQHIKATK